MGSPMYFKDIFTYITTLFCFSINSFKYPQENILIEPSEAFIIHKSFQSPRELSSDNFYDKNGCSRNFRRPEIIYSLSLAQTETIQLRLQRLSGATLIRNTRFEQPTLYTSISLTLIDKSNPVKLQVSSTVPLVPVVNLNASS